MTDITAIPSDEPELPSYSDPGRILVRILGPCWTRVYRYEFEVLDHDGCTYWIADGEGFDYWLDRIDFLAPGLYVIEGITGVYHRVYWGYTDDDVTWDYGVVRTATLEECIREEFVD